MPAMNPQFRLAVMALFAAAAGAAWTFPNQAWILPTFTAGLGLVAAGFTILQRLPRSRGVLGVNTATTLLFGGFLAMTPLLGPPVAAVAFAVASFTTIARIRLVWLPVVAIGFGLFAWMLVAETFGLIRPGTLIRDHLIPV